MNKVGSVSLLLIIWQAYDGAFNSGAFEDVPGSNIIFVAFIGVALWLLFFGVAITTSLLWLPRKDVVSVCYCVPAKGPAMGVPLAITIFAGIDPGLQSKIQVPVVIYQGIQIVGGSIMITVFRRWVDAEQRKCVKELQNLATIPAALGNDQENIKS
jgi:sodium/bile acid cotransporter 7